MEQGLLAFGLDIVIALLLSVMIVYAYMLNHRLNKLREDREEMEKLLRKFHDATSRAEAATKGLKQNTQSLGQDLQEMIDKAKSLRDEMLFMLERGDLLAGQLENSIRSSRVEKTGPDLDALLQKSAQAPDRQAKKSSNSLEDIFHSDQESQSAAERELLKALKGVR